MHQEVDLENNQSSSYMNDCLMKEDKSHSINSAKLMYLLERIDGTRKMKFSRWVQKKLLGSFEDNFRLFMFLVGTPIALVVFSFLCFATKGTLTFNAAGLYFLLSCLGSGFLSLMVALNGLYIISEWSNYLSNKQLDALMVELEKDIEVDFDKDLNNTPEKFEKILSVIKMLENNVYIKHCDTYKKPYDESKELKRKLNKNKGFMEFEKAYGLINFTEDLEKNFRETVKERGLSASLIGYFVRGGLLNVLLGNFLVERKQQVNEVNSQIEHLL